MNRVLERYLSFDGRLARLPFFARGIGLGVAAAVVFMLTIPLAWLAWWAGLVVAALCVALLAVGSVSLTVRRLHDIGLSGYHAIWVGAAELGWSFLSYGPPDAVFLGLPLAVICLWLTFWPGNRKANRFGEVPA